MRAKTTIVSSLLCAVLVLGFAVSAQASITYQVQTSPLNAVKNGVAEVMGDVSLTVSASPAPTGIAANDQITITYSQAGIIPEQAAVGVASAGGVASSPTGWSVTATAGFPAFSVTVTPSVPSIGGTVTIRFGAAGAPVAGTDTITVAGVRASVLGRPVAGLVITQFTAAPSGSSSFIVTSSPTVAFVVDNFSVSATSSSSMGVRIPICQPGGTASFKVKEESLTTWVNYTTATDGRSVPGIAPLPGLAAGGNANSQVHFVVDGVPTGVTIYWPAVVLSNEDIDSFTPGIQQSQLNWVSQSTNGSDAIYSFSTVSQASSDNTVETFTFNFTFATSGTTGSGIIAVTLATPPGSATTLQAQEYPADSATSTARPRFQDPLRAALDFATYVDCVTNLLFPWVGSLPSIGYDTGVAVANTGYDVGAIVPATVGDDGVIRMYFYPQTNGAAPVAPTPITTAVIRPGDTYANTMSALGINTFGYMIAVCEFRFGHGFAFITQGTIGGTLDIAHGYLALVLDTGALGAGRAFVEQLNN